MYRNGGKWYSEFPPVRGQEQVVSFNKGILALTAFDTLTGGHAAIYLECVDKKGDASFDKIDLTVGDEGSDKLENTGSGSSASSSSGSGSKELRINVEPRENNEEHRDRGKTMLYRSFVVTNDEIKAVRQAVEDFKADVAKGKYVYHYFGGDVGKMTARRGQRGVNCADFCEEILSRAKIEKPESRFITTPRCHRYSEEMKPEDMAHMFCTDRLIKTETSTLVGMRIKGEIDWALPSPKVIQEALLSEIHQSMK